MNGAVLNPNPNPYEKVIVVRTERGLTIAGTRITLYDVIAHLKAQYHERSKNTCPGCICVNSIK